MSNSSCLVTVDLLVHHADVFTFVLKGIRNTVKLVVSTVAVAIFQVDAVDRVGEGALACVAIL